MYFKVEFQGTTPFHKKRHLFSPSTAITNCLHSKCISKYCTKAKGHGGVDGTEEKNDGKVIQELISAESIYYFSGQPRAKITSKETNCKRHCATLCNFPSRSFLSLLSLILFDFVKMSFHFTLNLTWYKRFENYPRSYHHQLSPPEFQIWKTAMIVIGSVGE